MCAGGPRDFTRQTHMHARYTRTKYTIHEEKSRAVTYRGAEWHSTPDINACPAWSQHGPGSPFLTNSIWRGRAPAYSHKTQSGEDERRPIPIKLNLARADSSQNAFGEGNSLLFSFGEPRQIDFRRNPPRQIEFCRNLSSPNRFCREFRLVGHVPAGGLPRQNDFVGKQRLCMPIKLFSHSTTRRATSLFVVSAHRRQQDAH